jgi:hypothetical protein
MVAHVPHVQMVVRSDVLHNLTKLTNYSSSWEGVRSWMRRVSLCEPNLT